MLTKEQSQQKGILVIRWINNVLFGRHHSTFFPTILSSQNWLMNKVAVAAGIKLCMGSLKYLLLSVWLASSKLALAVCILSGHTEPRIWHRSPRDSSVYLWQVAYIEYSHLRRCSFYLTCIWLCLSCLQCFYPKNSSCIAEWLIHHYGVL